MLVDIDTKKFSGDKTEVMSPETVSNFPAGKFRRKMGI